MAGKPGPKPGTVNNPKGINQYSTNNPSDQKYRDSANKINPVKVSDYLKGTAYAKKASNEAVAASLKMIDEHKFTTTVDPELAKQFEAQMLREIAKGKKK